MAQIPLRLNPKSPHFHRRPKIHTLAAMKLATIHRYVAKEILLPFLLSLFILTFVLIMFQILKITEMVVSYGVDLADVLKALVYILPPFLVFTIPMAFLLGVILAVGRLSSESELVAMKASGIGLHQLLPPVIVIAAAAYGVSAFIALKVDPWGKQQFKTMLYEVGRKNATLGLKEKVFNDQFEDFMIYVDDIDTKTQELKGIFISDERNPDVPNIIIADKGKLTPLDDEMKLVIRLESGAMHRTLSDDAAYEYAGFKTYNFVLDFEKMMADGDFNKTYLEMTQSELSDHIRKLREGDDKFEMRRAWTEYHRRYSFPCACLIFGILGLALGVVPPRSGRGQGFTFAIGAICIYYLLFRVGENLGWKGVMHPAMAMWMPNIVFAVFAAYMLRNKTLERSVWLLDKPAAAARVIIAKVKSKISGNGVGGSDQ